MEESKEPLKSFPSPPTPWMLAWGICGDTSGAFTSKFFCDIP